MLIFLLAAVFAVIFVGVSCKHSKSSNRDAEDEEQNDDENPVEQDAIEAIPEQYSMNQIENADNFNENCDSYGQPHALPTVATGYFSNRRKTNYRGRKVTQATTKEEVADASDPNYETLAACPRKNVFGRDKKVVAPMAATHDPNYQTMAPLQRDVFGEDKARRNNEKYYTRKNYVKPRPPNLSRTVIVPTHDPNYATMVAMDNNVFGSDKRKKKKEKKMQYAKMTIVPGTEAVVGANEPNYQTLAAVDNVFGADKQKKLKKRR